MLELKDNQVKKLLEYSGKPELKQLAVNMAVTRLKFMYKQNPAPAVLSQCTSEMNALLNKIASIAQDDYSWIVKLIGGIIKND